MYIVRTSAFSQSSQVLYCTPGRLWAPGCSALWSFLHHDGISATCCGMHHGTRRALITVQLQLLASHLQREQCHLHQWQQTQYVTSIRAEHWAAQRQPPLGCSPLLQQSTLPAAGSRPRRATPGPLRSPACQGRAHPQMPVLQVSQGCQAPGFCSLRQQAGACLQSQPRTRAPLQEHLARAALRTGRCPACSTQATGFSNLVQPKA